MRYADIQKRAAGKLTGRLEYTYCYYLEFDFSILKYILSRKKNGSKSKLTYSEAYIMLDTETSKDHATEYDKDGKAIPQENHLVCWTISIRAFHTNICTLRGSKPSELTHCLELIRNNIQADVCYIFIHNLPYDWQFIRRFMFQAFGYPKKQLNVKNHYPITIQFNNGLILRDSLILAGVSLERWSDNLNVEHKKAVGFWNYLTIRNQNTILTPEELTYIEFDTLAGVECLNKLADTLGDTLVSLPFTNTGIVRRHIRKIGRKNYAKKLFNDQKIELSEYDILEHVFHGGYTHANRNIVGWIRSNVQCYDFKSSYPFCMLTCKVPRESFIHFDRPFTPYEILQDDNNAYIFKLIGVNVRLRDPRYPMPALQFFKTVSSINATCDNGRILEADYIEIYLNEIDLKVIMNQYEFDGVQCVEVMGAFKDYIPKYFRDEVFNIFKEKCELEYEVKTLKTGDISMYNTKKAQLNSLYGMSVTRAIREEIREAYEDDKVNLRISGDYYIGYCDREKLFNKYLKDRNQILPYIWGVYVTSYAMLHLFELSECIDDINRHWLYSDTDSIYSDNWNMERLNRYNEAVKRELKVAGYGPVTVNEKTYHLGVADPDGFYDEFITQGAKRYAVTQGKKIKITVAGVPKKTGAACLRSLDDFTEGFIFYGQGTGKTTHTYIYNDIHIDGNGNEVADSIDLTDADYTLSSVVKMRFDELVIEEIYQDCFEDI